MNRIFLLFILALFCMQLYPSECFADDSAQSMLQSTEVLNFKMSFFSWILVVVGILGGFIIGRAYVLNKARREIADVLNKSISKENLGYSFSIQIFDKFTKQDETINEFRINNMNKYNPNKHEIDLLKVKLDEHRNEIFSKIEKIKMLENTIRELIIRIKSHEPDFEYMGNSIGIPKDPLIESDPIKIVSPPVESETERSKLAKFNRQIFFSMPESNGSFKISDGESFNDGRMNFRIEYEDTNHLGELGFISSDRDQKAINHLESYLKPVCEIENISSVATASKITVLNKGLVKLVNDSWVIDPNNKIKLKLY